MLTEIQLSRVCDSILRIDGVSSCIIFDREGRKLDARAKGNPVSDLPSKYGGMIGSAIIGGLKPVEAFAGKLGSVVATFEGLRAVATTGDSGISVVVTVPVSTDADYVRRMVRSELTRREVEAVWGIPKSQQ